MPFPFIAAAIGFFSSAVAAVSSIGASVASFATGLATTIATLPIPTIKQCIDAIVNCAQIVMRVFGALQPGESVEDLGERALQAKEQGITTDQFDDFDDYMDALRNFELDPDKAAQRNPLEKQLAGLGVGTAGLEHKLNVGPGELNGIWLLPMVNSEYFTPERMESLLKAGQLGGNILGYLENRLSVGESRSFEKGMEVDAEGKPLDKAGLSELYQALDSSREGWADLINQTKAPAAAVEGA